MSAFKILVIDDEEAIAEFISINLKRAGFEVVTASDGIAGILAVTEHQPDLVVLDLMLPDIDGFDVCKKIREHYTVPIIMLTARGDDLDKISGLGSGADDYMVKPFNPWELIARIQAILRRIGTVKETAKTNSEIKYGEITIDSFGRKAWKRGNLIELTPREYDLLILFFSNPGKSFSRDDLRTLVWGHEFIEERSIDVHIRRLRDKIEDTPDSPSYILTIWGVGYKSNPEIFASR